MSTDCYLGISFANGSDVCLPLRTVFCEHVKLPFGAFLSMGSDI